MPEGNKSRVSGVGVGMKPYYDDGQITIYHGDCREILPTLEPVDLVLTDPPYGVHVDYGAFQDTPENLKSLISETWPLIRASGAVVLATTGVKHLVTIQHLTGFCVGIHHLILGVVRGAFVLGSQS